MSDKTIVKPRPGRKSLPQQKPQDNALSEQSNQTLADFHPKTSFKQSAILTISENELVDTAETFLSYSCQLRGLSSVKDITSIRLRVVELIKIYEQVLRQKHIPAKVIENARYCLCCFVDEIVMNQEWGEIGNWASASMLSTFHSETFGGEYFYIILDDSLKSPNENVDLIELMYLCLSLGFVGKMRIEQNGTEQIDTYKEKCFRVLKENKRKADLELSPNVSERIVKGNTLSESFPIWLILLFSGVLLSVIYMTFSYKINNYSSDVYKELNSLVPWTPENTAVKENLSRDEAIQLQQLLQTEITMKFLEIEQLSDRVRIRIGAGVLFASGSTVPRTDFEPVLAKIARAIEGGEGKILITGHTDDTPIFTTRYPSNWHLSLARSTAIGNFLADNAALKGRIWPEGRGESEPLVMNDSEQNKAQNRRIEIDLLF